MSKVIHVHIGKSRDAREERFGIPVYTEAEIMKKLRDGEWEAQTDVIKGKRVEMRKGSKRFQIYVADAKAKDGISPSVKASIRKALSEANSEYADSSHTQEEGRKLLKVIELLSQCERML